MVSSSFAFSQPVHSLSSSRFAPSFVSPLHRTSTSILCPAVVRRPLPRKLIPSCASPPLPSPSPPPEHPTDPRLINGTTPFYLALVAAQLLPFLNVSSLAGDFAYFTITALSVIVIGVRRAPLEPPVLTAELSGKQAVAAPFTASLFLFGSYLLLKYTTLDVGLIFNVMTTFAGAVCVKEALDPVFHTILASLSLPNFVLYTPKPSNPNSASPEKQNPVDPQVDVSKETPPFILSNALSLFTALGIVIAYWLKLPPSFVFSNVIAVSIGTRILSIIRPSSFLVGAGLLIGLFFYDIFWVFGSDVMVSVATQIDMPAKLLYPRDIAESATSAIKYPYAILGLGDVCIPGLFISLAQSIDLRLAPDSSRPIQTYFPAAVAAYIAGLVTCFGVNFVTGAAQPALLYLVPSLILSTTSVAALRGELAKVISFSTD